MLRCREVPSKVNGGNVSDGQHHKGAPDNHGPTAQNLLKLLVSHRFVPLVPRSPRRPSHLSCLRCDLGSDSQEKNEVMDFTLRLVTLRACSQFLA
jgi:hypothetical protein